MNINIPEARNANVEDKTAEAKMGVKSLVNSEATSTESRPTVVVESKINPEEVAKKKAVPIKVPDLFANVRVKQPDHYLEYKKTNPGGSEI